MIKFQYDDGGRSKYFKGTCGDCGVRAATIALDEDYKTIYDIAQSINETIKLPKRKRQTKNSSIRTGMHTEVMHKLMEMYGFTWVPTMKIGQGCKVHVRESELPQQTRLVLNLSRHFSAVVNGVLRDTYNCSREGTRCVYGYWIER